MNPEQLQAEGVLDDTWAWIEEQADALLDDDASIEEDPEAHRETVESYLGLLDEIHGNLARAQVLLPTSGPEAATLQATFSAFVQRYNSLALGVVRDAREERPGALPRTFGAWQVVLIVAGVALGAAAIAWAVVAYEEALATRDQTALFLEDLRERAAASREGRTLQAATVNAPPPPDDESYWPLVLAGLGVLGVGGFLAYQASQSSRS